MTTTIPQTMSDLHPAIQARCARHVPGVDVQPMPRALAVIVQRDGRMPGVEYTQRAAYNWWQVETMLVERTDCVAVLLSCVAVLLS